MKDEKLNFMLKEIYGKKSKSKGAVSESTHWSTVFYILLSTVESYEGKLAKSWKGSRSVNPMQSPVQITGFDAARLKLRNVRMQ